MIFVLLTVGRPHLPASLPHTRGPAAMDTQSDAAVIDPLIAVSDGCSRLSCLAWTQVGLLWPEAISDIATVVKYSGVKW